MVSLLADAALGRPAEPWLFFRDGLDWRWRSYDRVADQVARGARVLDEGADEPGSADAPFGISPNLRPEDRVAAILAALAAGRTTAWPMVDEGPGFGPGPGQTRLPSCRGALDPFIPEPLRVPEPLGAPEDGEGSLVAGERVLSSVETVAAARGLVRELDREPVSRGRRPILFVESALVDGPDLTLPISIALSLELDAAWTLADAFVPTVLWVRPTLVVATPEGVEGLCRALQADDGRRRRKHSRLLRALVRTAADPGRSTLGAWRRGLDSEVDLWLDP